MSLKNASLPARPPDSNVNVDGPLKIVAIGASAGGLEAITELLLNISPDTGMAFIYIPHLSPDHKSILTTLLSRTTSMKVQEVTNKILMKPDNLYVIPPDKAMEVIDGHILLTTRSKEHVVHLPIDTFFCTLADKHKENAIGVVLSGRANDGTIGLLAIKAAGGLTFAQDDSAKFNSMPQSAIISGAVDFVLSPKKMASELVRISKFNLTGHDNLMSGEDEIESTNSDLKIIFNLLLKQTHVDFSLYKMPTIKRRLLRRMHINQIQSLKQYAKFAAQKNDEITILYQDLLINVTNFFRDGDAHEYLRAVLFPAILKGKNDNEKLRVWIPACASGEEAYSIAMTLLEIQSVSETHIPVQIFATDLSTKAIAKARIGEYGKSDLQFVSPKRLQRFYTKTGTKYRISKSVREMCVFAPHNILRDPPFSKVDFISCCNLFIYLDTAAQKKVLATFHYALNEDGYLLLGKSETIGSSDQLFSQISKKVKIYSRRTSPGGRRLPELLPASKEAVDLKRKNRVVPLKTIHAASVGFDAAVSLLLLAKYVPASVVINHAMEILQFRGDTNPFIKHPTGKASLNILNLTPPEIAFELRHEIPIAITTKQVVRKTGIEVKALTKIKAVTIEIVPLHTDWEEPLLLILFTVPERVETFLTQGKKGKADTLARDRKIRKLEDELTASKTSLHALANEQRAFIEELQSANEEVVSSNEELQSLNEELETSKEETESTNEELITTNQELQTRNELLNESYQYSDAILANIHEPLLVLDKDLRVVSASKSFYKMFSFTPEETEGILLYDVGNKEWDIPALRQLLEDILPKDSHFQDFEVANTFPRLGEKIMMLNASRIVQKVHHEQLILLAIADVTDVRKKAVESVTKEKNFLSEENHQLEKAVENRTLELRTANETLFEKNVALVNINKELQAFTYIASHDLQEPLRKIQTLSNMILAAEAEKLSDKGIDYFQRMQGAAKRMRTLIEDLLAFSGITSTAENREKTDLNVLIRQVKLELKDIIKEKHASVRAGQLCELNVIPFQFHQLMLNLIGNSLKYAKPQVNSLITITSKIFNGGIAKMPTVKKYCHIVVTDNGIGFEEEYNERIFEVFQRLHRKEDYEGTGIGLAIVRKIVENHGGVITATGNSGIGAKFEIYIPV